MEETEVWKNGSKQIFKVGEKIYRESLLSCMQSTMNPTSWCP